MFRTCDSAKDYVYSVILSFVILPLLKDVSQSASAQDSLPPVTTLQNPDSGANLARFFTSKTPYEFWLSCLIGLFGLAIIGALILAVRRTENARPEDVARPIIVVTVIIGTLLLVTVGYNNEQIAPAFGLFGTIVGYLLGRLAQTQPSTAPRADQQQGGS